MARHLRRASSSEGISLISSFEAQGLWGQYIYVCPKTKVLIADREQMGKRSAATRIGIATCTFSYGKNQRRPLYNGRATQVW